MSLSVTLVGNPGEANPVLCSMNGTYNQPEGIEDELAPLGAMRVSRNSSVAACLC